MKSFNKTILIVFLILVSSILHIRTPPSDFGLHILHQELFFLPIILSSFWFGLRSGLIVAAIVCTIYTPLVLQHGGQPMQTMTWQISLQLIMYLIVASLIGWLSDRQRFQQKLLLQEERIASLTKAASTISFEIKEIVQRLEKISSDASNLKETADIVNFQQETGRLNELVAILSEYKQEEEPLSPSKDLNKLLQNSMNKFKQPAHRASVEFVLDMDVVGCRTMIAGDALEHTIDSLIDNALDVSEQGQKIILSSKREGGNCVLTVTDEGPEISPENQKKLFSPFFTTKPHGSGLGLSAGRKMLRDHGGDLVYKTNPGGGASFSIIVPPEDT